VFKRKLFGLGKPLEKKTSNEHFIQNKKAASLEAAFFIEKLI